MTLFPLKMRYGFESPSILCTGYMCVFDLFIVGERDKIYASIELGSFDEYMFYVGMRRISMARKLEYVFLHT